MLPRLYTSLSLAARWALSALVIFAQGAVAAAADEVARFHLADGVEMAYVDRGVGDPTLVFIHCGNCQMGIWRETLDAFAPTNRVVAMDLPGHGQSGANRESWSLEGLGADVAALALHLKVQRSVLVGNSLGGPTALEAAKRLGPSRVLGVVAVDTLHNVEFVWPEEDFNNMLASYRKDFSAACDAAMLRLVPQSAPQETKDRISRETCDNDARAFRSLFETLRSYDQAAALRAAGVPVRAINATLFPTAVEVNRKYEPSFEVVLMEGVGHYPQVEHAAEFQRQLRRLVSELAAGR
jgi:pimeloyl-ACP methyl ester carboxylesterase